MNGYEGEGILKLKGVEVIRGEVCCRLKQVVNEEREVEGGKKDFKREIYRIEIRVDADDQLEEISEIFEKIANHKPSEFELELDDENEPLILCKVTPHLSEMIITCTAKKYIEKKT